MAFLLPMIPALIGMIASIGSTVGGGIMARNRQEDQQQFEQQQRAGAPGGGQALAPASSAPGMNPMEFRNQQSAFWQQALAGLGQGTAGGALPEGIQSMIDKQASLIG